MTQPIIGLSPVGTSGPLGVKVGLNIASQDTLIDVSEARTAVGTQFRRGVNLARRTAPRSSTMVLVFRH
jgi:polysaccharide deacetylase 2 family uncharacterized protein YibQ